MKSFELPDIANFKKKPPRRPGADNSNFKISDKIDENYKVATWSETTFVFEKIDIEPITKSLFLMDDEKFKELVNIIIGYNQEVELAKRTGHPNKIRNGPWRSQFHLKLYSILMEIVITKNRMLQQNYLDRAFNWAMETKKNLDSGAPPEDEGASKKIFSAVSEHIQDIQDENETETLGELPSKQFSDYFPRPISGVTRPTTAITRPPSGATRPLSGLIKLSSNKTQRPFSSTVSGQRKEKAERPFSALLSVDNEPSLIKDETLKDEIKPKKSARSHSQHQVSKKKIPPSKLIEENLSDYKTKLRTQHFNEDPPDQRLKEFNRRILINEKEESQDDSYDKAVEKMNETKSRVKETIADYDKKRANYFKPEEELPIDPEELEARKLLEEEKLKAKKAKLEKKKKRPGSSSRSSLDKKKKRKKKTSKATGSVMESNLTLEPEEKPFQNDEISLDEFLDRDQQLNHKFEYRSNYVNYVPTDDPREKEMELLWMKNRHKEIADKRSDEEFVNMMYKWANARERVETEISRKIQSAYEASQFDKCEYQPKAVNLKDFTSILDKTKATKYLESDSIQIKKKDDDEEDEPKYKLDNSDDLLDEEDNETRALGDFELVNGKIKKRPFSSIVPSTTKIYEQDKKPTEIGFNGQSIKSRIANLEQNKSRQKIQELRNTVGKVINANHHEEGEVVARQKSMSVYSNGTILPRRPFSAVLERNPARLIQRQQLDEVDEVKNRLAQYKTSIPINVLTRALVIPEMDNIRPEDLEKARVPQRSLIPYIEIPEKKKKKRAKSGKKKKK